MLTRRGLSTSAILGGMTAALSGGAPAEARTVAVCPICGCRIIVTAGASY